MVIVTDVRGWKSFQSICGCTFALANGGVLGMCHEHDFYASEADNVVGILTRMRAWVKDQAEAREAA